MCASMKCGTRDEAVSLGLLVAELPSVRLVPVGPWILGEDAVVADMARWRNRASDAFFARFPESVEGMSKYLKVNSIMREDTLLFMISCEGSFVGHVGLKGIREDCAELDAVMRGEMFPNQPGLMGRAIERLLMWAQNVLEIGGFELRVLSSNERALALYQRLGFVVSASHALAVTTQGTLTSLIEVPDEESTVSERSVTMTLHLDAESQ